MTKGLALFAIPAVLPLMGCIVGQAPGEGSVLHLQEPVTKGWYWLYLPEDYVREEVGLLTNRRWPLVVTFHGMKPFDNAGSQIREWQQEADRYGFVVVAPECASPDLLAEFPIRKVHAGVARDEQLTVAMLDDVAGRVDIDPANILSTSWSSGGYLAHYLPNRYPERFSCIAPRQSNFSADVLDPLRVPAYRNNKVGIFYTENDFKICRDESQEAARWYAQHGFDVTFAVFKDLGHERRPSVAAAFFARTCGAMAKTPPAELARMQVKDVALTQLSTDGAVVLPPVKTFDPSSRPAGHSREVAASAGPDYAVIPGAAAQLGLPEPGTVGSGTLAARPTPSSPQHRPATPGPLQVTALPPATPPIAEPSPRSDRLTEESATNSTLQVRVSSSIGIAPLLVSFSAMVPASLRRGSFFLWTDNGEPISNGITGQKYLAMPGKHRIEVIMTTTDGREYRAGKIINVLERVGDGRSAAAQGR